MPSLPAGWSRGAASVAASDASVSSSAKTCQPTEACFLCASWRHVTKDASKICRCGRYHVCEDCVSDDWVCPDCEATRDDLVSNSDYSEKTTDQASCSSDGYCPPQPLSSWTAARASLDDPNEQCPPNLSKLSKLMNMLLRHRALDHGLRVSPEGFVAVADVIQALQSHKCWPSYLLPAAAITEVAYKSIHHGLHRFELRCEQGTDQIRATRRHSIPVQTHVALTPGVDYLARHVAREDFDASKYGSEYLSLSRGENVFVIEGQLADGWAKGSNRLGTGWFPAAYVEHRNRTPDRQESFVRAQQPSQPQKQVQEIDMTRAGKRWHLDVESKTYKELENLIPGMGNAVTAAHIAPLAEKIVAWIERNQAAYGSEVLENFESVAQFSGLTPISKSRFKAALECFFGSVPVVAVS